MSVRARESHAAFADDHDLLVFEDDPYGLLRIDGAAKPLLYQTLCERGRHDLAISSSSFSKTVAPGLRVGYLLLPEEFVPAISALALRSYVSPPLLPQAHLFEFLSAGYLDGHLEFVRASLRDRRNMLLTTFDERMPAGARWTRPDGGYFLWLELPEPVEADAVNVLASEAGVTFVPGSVFFPDERASGEPRISFSYPSVDEVRSGAIRLAATLHRALEHPA
jgi:2-aminoadipate transaminase